MSLLDSLLEMADENETILRAVFPYPGGKSRSVGNILPLLEKEAPDFLAEVLHLELPESNDRLNVPALLTEDKVMSQELNQNAIETFISEKCQHAPGYMLKLSDLYNKFQEWLPVNERRRWTKQRMTKSLPSYCAKGRMRQTGQFHIGNITWLGESTEVSPRLMQQDGYLEPYIDH